MWATSLHVLTLHSSHSASQIANSSLFPKQQEGKNMKATFSCTQTEQGQPDGFYA
jgi:exopolyphosphatase/pppGpp-phosphohydrolase